MENTSLQRCVGSRPSQSCVCKQLLCSMFIKLNPCACPFPLPSVFSMGAGALQMQVSIASPIGVGTNSSFTLSFCRRLAIYKVPLRQSLRAQLLSLETGSFSLFLPLNLTEADLVEDKEPQKHQHSFKGCSL